MREKRREGQTEKGGGGMEVIGGYNVCYELMFKCEKRKFKFHQCGLCYEVFVGGEIDGKLLCYGSTSCVSINIYCYLVVLYFNSI